MQIMQKMPKMTCSLNFWSLVFLYTYFFLIKKRALLETLIIIIKPFYLITEN